MTPKGRSVLLRQYAAAITGCITVAGYGAIITWSSPSLPYLRSQGLITEDESSWIASLFLLGFIIGFFMNPLFVDRIGRKWTLLLFSIPQIISWLIIIFSMRPITFYVARVIGGIGYGGGICAMTVYMTEIGNKDNRGSFLILIRLSMGIGFLYTTFLGAYFTYQQMNIALLCLPICFVVIFLFMPDSTYFLKINDTLKEEGFDSQKVQLDKIIHANEKKLCLMEGSEKSLTPRLLEEEKREFFERNANSRILAYCGFDCTIFSNPVHRKALMIVILAGLINILSGQVILTSFGQQILTYDAVPMDPSKSMVLLSGLNFIACLMSTKIIDHLRRRTILILCGLTSSISLLIVGVFFHLEPNISHSSFLRWIPVTFLSIFDTFLSAGPSNIFYIYQGEFFAKQVKSFSVTIVKFVYISFGFLTVYLFQKVIKITGMDGIFFIFASCCAITTVFVYLIAPESQGKELEEIQESLKKKSVIV